MFICCCLISGSSQSIGWCHVLRMQLLTVVIQACLHVHSLTTLFPVVDCGDPGTPMNGQRSLSSTTHNSVVTYTCDVGYTLQGSNSRTCQSSGRWSGSVPQCTCKLLVFNILICTVYICHCCSFHPIQHRALAPVRTVALVQPLTPALVLQDGQECCVKHVS